MLDQETRYAHWSSLLSTRTRHFLPEGPKCFPLESPGGRRYYFFFFLFFSKDIVDQGGWSNRGIIVINPLRCVKLVLSTLSCVSDRVSWQFLTEGRICFPQKDIDHMDNYFFPAVKRRADASFYAGTICKTTCSSERGSGRFTFVTNQQCATRSSLSSRFLALRRN